VLVTYEGDYSGYVGQNPTSGLNYLDPGWVPSDPDKFWHIIYDVGPSRVADVIATSHSRRAGYVYVTDDVPENPYETIPNSAYWQSEQDNVAGGIITSAPAAALPDGEPMPGTPSDLTVLGSDYTSATLGWAATANAMSYFIYVNGRLVAELPASLSTVVSIGGLIPGSMDYRFHVTARGRSGQISGPSNSAVAMTASLPDGQTITETAASVNGSTVTYSAKFLTPYAFRRVFIPEDSGFTSHSCWYSNAGVRARYLIENTTLLEYAGDDSGTQWQWTPIAYTPPTIDGSTYSWTVQAGDVDGASADVQINGEGFSPATYVRAGHPDHRYGTSPGAAFVDAVAVGITATDGAAAP
jgi:hypothetical protein